MSSFSKRKSIPFINLSCSLFVNQKQINKMSNYPKDIIKDNQIQIFSKWAIPGPGLFLFYFLPLNGNSN